MEQRKMLTQTGWFWTENNVCEIYHFHQRLMSRPSQWARQQTKFIQRQERLLHAVKGRPKTKRRHMKHESKRGIHSWWRFFIILWLVNASTNAEGWIPSQAQQLKLWVCSTDTGLLGKEKNRQKLILQTRRKKTTGKDEVYTGACCTDKSLHVPVWKIILKQYWLRVEQMWKQCFCLGSFTFSQTVAAAMLENMTEPCFSLSS